MTFDEVIDYYGNQTKACEAIGLSRASFSEWRKKGYIPLLSQIRFEQLTNGALQADNSQFRKPGRKNKNIN